MVLVLKDRSVMTISKTSKGVTIPHGHYLCNCSNITAIVSGNIVVLAPNDYDNKRIRMDLVSLMSELE